MTFIAENLARVTERIHTACRAAGRPSNEVRLLPVSKTQPSSVIRLAVAAGCREFGENRVQELVTKAEEVPGVTWEMIGHLQRNKVRPACAVMSLLQSLDSLDLAQALNKEYEASRQDSRLDVLIEVNTSGEATKNGLDPSKVLGFTQELKAYEHLRPLGLMTVAHPVHEIAVQGFAGLAHLQTQLRDRDGGGWDELSMGMSTDYQEAIAHGSTCVRIGTAIFGQRS